MIVYFESDSREGAEEYANLYGWYCINTNEDDSFKLSSEIVDNTVLDWNEIQSRYWNKFVCIDRTEGLKGVVRFWSLIMEDVNNYAFKHNLYSTITNIDGADKYVSKMLNNMRLNGL